MKDCCEKWKEYVKMHNFELVAELANNFCPRCGSPLKQEPPKIEQLNIPMSVDWDNMKLLEDKINELIRAYNKGR